jgi:hypothetical protein
VHKALIIKELRESAGIVALAVLVLVLVYVESTGGLFSRYLGHELMVLNTRMSLTIPFAGSMDQTANSIAMVAAGLAIALGLKQSVRELAHGSYLFLLHRPMARKQIFGLKLAVGMALLLSITGAMILCCALWAATPGNVAAPFFWSMTVPVWQIWFSMTLVYLGAFLTGIRPGRWFGTRLVPLVACAPIVYIAALIPWWWAGVLLVLVADGLFVVSIFHSAGERDY